LIRTAPTVVLVFFPLLRKDPQKKSTASSCAAALSLLMFVSPARPPLSLPLKVPVAGLERFGLRQASDVSIIVIR